MIDIYDFIDFVALRKNLKKEGCDLSPLDCAGIAWRSQKRSLREKLAVMRELLSNSENFPLPFDEYTEGNNNFHFLLREKNDRPPGGLSRQRFGDFCRRPFFAAKRKSGPLVCTDDWVRQSISPD